MKQIKRFASSFNCTERPVTEKESISIRPEDDLVEREGYIPFHIQIESMMIAGTNLARIRADEFDYEGEMTADDMADAEITVEHSRSFDMADVSRLNNDLQDRAKSSRKASRKSTKTSEKEKADETEEPKEHEPKESEPLDPEPVE